MLQKYESCGSKPWYFGDPKNFQNGHLGYPREAHLNVTNVDLDTSMTPTSFPFQSSKTHLHEAAQIMNSTCNMFQLFNHILLHVPRFSYGFPTVFADVFCPLQVVFDEEFLIYLHLGHPWGLKFSTQEPRNSQVGGASVSSLFWSSSVYNLY